MRATLYRFPPAWRGIERGLTKAEVRRRLGNPGRIETRSDLKKSVESWFYGPKDAYAVVFVDDHVLVKASTTL